MILREYQKKLVNDVRMSFAKGLTRPLVQLPTGGGKAVILNQICYNAIEKGNDVLVLAHRNELLEQLGKTASELFKMNASYISPEFSYNPYSKLQIGSVQTVANRLDKIKKPKIIIIDECHHFRVGSTYDKILKHFNTWSVGFTATPCRLSGEPLNDYFSNLILGPSIKKLIAEGFLSDYDLFAPPSNIDFSKFKLSMGDFNSSEIEEAVDKPMITGNAVEHYLKHSKNKQAVAFCTSIRHAQNVSAAFRSSGISSATLYSGIPSVLRKQIIKDFREDKIKVITNCGIISEGFDLSGIHTVIQLRPTASLSLYLQMIGRALRIDKNKDKAIILDHVGNADRHGLPCQERDWSLNGKIKSKKKSGQEPIKTCPECFCVVSSFTKTCPECGHEFVVESRDEIVEQDGDLVKINKDGFGKGVSFRDQQKNAETMEDLIRIGRSKGMKHPYGWARHVFQSRQLKKLRNS